MRRHRRTCSPRTRPRPDRGRAVHRTVVARNVRRRGSIGTVDRGLPCRRRRLAFQRMPSRSLAMGRHPDARLGAGPAPESRGNSVRSADEWPRTGPMGAAENAGGGRTHPRGGLRMPSLYEGVVRDPPRRPRTVPLSRLPRRLPSSRPKRRSMRLSSAKTAVNTAALTASRIKMALRIASATRCVHIGPEAD